MNKEKIIIISSVSGIVFLLACYFTMFYIFWDTSEHYHPTQEEKDAVKIEYVFDDTISAEEFALNKCDEFIEAYEGIAQEKDVGGWWEVRLVKSKQVKRDLLKGRIDGWTALYALRKIGEADFELSFLKNEFQFPFTILIPCAVILFPAVILFIRHRHYKKRAIPPEAEA